MIWIGFIVYVLAAIVFSAFAARKSAYNAATQYWGLKLTSSKDTIGSLQSNGHINHYMKTINVNGLQGAITTKKQKVKRNISIALNLLFFFVGAAFFLWYVPLLTLLAILILKNIFRQKLPPANSKEYLQQIITDLEEQSILYQEEKKLEEKEASDFFIRQLQVIRS